MMLLLLLSPACLERPDPSLLHFVNGLKHASADAMQPVDALYPHVMRPEVPPQITHSHACAIRPQRGALHGCAHLAAIEVIGMGTV
jgi:hypothetical protein